MSDPQGRLILQNEAAERIWAGSVTAENVKEWSQYRDCEFIGGVNIDASVEVEA